MTFAAAVLALPLLAATPAEKPLRFAWPIPSHARVTETVEKKGRTAVLRYDASLVPAANDKLELRLSHVELVKSPSADVGGVQNVMDGLLEALQPTLVISRAGALEDVIGSEQAVAAVLGMARSHISDAEMLKGIESVLRSPEVAAAIKRKTGEYWELWVGAWAGAELKAGDDFTADVPLPLPDGTTVKQRTRVRHLGPDPEARGYVRLLLDGTLEGPEFTAAMRRVVGQLIPKGLPKDVPPADVFQSIRRELRLAAVTEAATLRPREAHSVTTTTVTLKTGETQTQVERRHYQFEWRQGP
jgi:hypothetical protein